MAALHPNELVLSLGKLTAAVILAVKTVLCGKFDASLVAVFFLEVRGKMFNAVLFRQFFAYLIELCGVFVGTDRKSCCKIIKVHFRRKFCGLFQPQTVAGEAASAALRDIFKTFYRLVKAFRLPAVLDKFNGVFAGKFGNKPFLFGDPVEKFFFRENIGIKIEHGYFKIFHQIFKHRA